MDHVTTFIATGDCFITRAFPPGGYPGFEPVRDIIMENDVRFTNLETTFHRMEGTPAAESGGTWAMADPERLDDIRSYGFNLFTTANNHSGDYGEGGVLATIRHIKERGMVFSGTGANLAEASAACYLETKRARVALVSACSTFAKASAAGIQSPGLPGRPGLNPLRFKTEYHLEKKYYESLQEIAALTSINAAEDYLIKTGYNPPKPEGTASFGSALTVLDQENKVVSKPDEADMARIEEEIKEAAIQADIVLVSIHAHDAWRDDQNRPAQFLETFSRRCIDAGASAVIGHGPHMIRGIERYRDGIIFYSLGNFIFETETVSLQPGDAYAAKKLPGTTRVGEYMNIRSNNETTGYAADPNIWNAVMAQWTVRDGKLTGARIYPIELGMGVKRSRRGVPVLSESDRTLKFLQSLSEPYGTIIRIEGNTGIIDL